MTRNRALLALCFVLGAGAPARAQDAPDQHRLGLDEVVRAVASSPAGAADGEALAAATDAVRLGLLPSVSLSAQVVRSAANVAPGATWGNEGVPAISGPPFDFRFDAGTWLTQLGVGVSIAPLDLIRRVQLLDAAVADEAQARGTRQLGALDRGVEAASAFLDLVAAEQARAAVGEEDGVLARREAATESELLRASLALERATLALRAAEAQHAEDGARARLAGLLGRAAVRVRLAAPEDEAGSPAGAGAPHPARAAADAAVRAGEARAEAARLELLPRVELLGALWARGTGLNFPGQMDTSAGAGLNPERPGWAVGLVLTWRALELPAAEARVRHAEARSRGDHARRRALETQMAGQVSEARARLEGARRVLASAAAALGSADALVVLAEAQAVSGGELAPWLAARRQRLPLAIGARLAPIALERARLVLARAEGDLEPFLARHR